MKIHNKTDMKELFKMIHQIVENFSEYSEVQVQNWIHTGAHCAPDTYY